MSDSEIHNQVAIREFNFVTTKNGMKMSSMQPNRCSYRWGPTDTLMKFDKANGMKVHGHTLVWYNQSPGWVQGIKYRNELIKAMKDHIKTVLTRYKGQIYAWDVVNEAFNEDGSFRRSFWYNTIGKDYIDIAFKTSREADPSTKLIYIDYNLAWMHKKSDGAYNMIKSMKQCGIPIDGVGFQAHFVAQGINYDSFEKNMARFAALGIEIYITELDVRINPNPNKQQLESQAEVYRRVMEKCLAQPAV